MRQRRLPLSALLLLSVVSTSAAEYPEVFENNCAACRGIDGKANTPQGRKVEVRDLRASKLTNAKIENRSHGVAKNKSDPTVMPAFGRDLTDAQVQEAIRTVKSFRPRGQSSGRCPDASTHSRPTPPES